MGFFKSIFKAAAPIIGAVIGGPLGFAGGSALAGLAQQQSDKRKRKIAEQAAEAQRASERSKVKMAEDKLKRERDRALNRINKGRLRAARGRIRGGLFGNPEESTGLGG